MVALPPQTVRMARSTDRSLPRFLKQTTIRFLAQRWKIKVLPVRVGVHLLGALEQIMLSDYASHDDGIHRLID